MACGVSHITTHTHSLQPHPMMELRKYSMAWCMLTSCKTPSLCRLRSCAIIRYAAPRMFNHATVN
eukprot:8643869-Ditylum_brightwellii.AAC.1